MLRRKYEARVDMKTGKIRTRKDIIFYQTDNNVNTVLLKLNRPFAGTVTGILGQTRYGSIKYEEPTQEIEIVIENLLEPGKYDFYLEFKHDDQIARTDILKFEVK